MAEVKLSEVLAGLPPARRAAALRAGAPHLLRLIEEVELAVGYPKQDGRWSPVLSLALGELRDQVVTKLEGA